MANCTNFAVESQPRMGVICFLQNTINGMGYVGQTIQKLSARLRQHRKSGKAGVDAAIKEYGWENFSVEVLEENIPREMLDEREIFWIAKLNTKTPNGYNLTDGGRNYVISDEICAKISESQKGKTLSAETRAKISATNKAKGIKPPPRTGQEPWNKGKTWSPETRKKLSESHMGNAQSEETRKKISATNKAKGIKPPSWKGRHHTEESRAKMSAVQKAKKKNNSKIEEEKSND